MKILHIVFPVNLYKKNKYITKEKDVCVYEDPVYFTKYKFHKMKLLFHRITMKKYYDALSSKNKKYIEYDENIINVIKKYDCIEFIYPADHDIVTKYTKICKSLNVTLKIYDTLNFLISMDEIKNYSGSIYHDRSFYPYMRKKLNIFMDNKGKPLHGKYSFDTENRKKIELKMDIINVKNDKYMKESTKYVENNFANNYGNMENMIYPTTHKEAKTLLQKFCKYKLNNFGTYEDAIDKNNPFLYHSQLSSSLNIGLLTDNDVIKYVIKYITKHTVKYNNIEGFIRQIIGWRNYVFFIYEKFGEEIRNSNFFNHHNKLSSKMYYGTTQISIVDDTIKKALSYCYLNHIERLMIMGNFMLLCEINPLQVMQWFMELVSIDAYDVFMVPNVICMSQYADGGLMMNRPYFCSSNYLLKMSNYSLKDKQIALKSGTYNWTYIFDSLYYNFVHNNKKALSKIYSTAMSVKMMEKKTDLKSMLKVANEYISFVTK